MHNKYKVIIDNKLPYEYNVYYRYLLYNTTIPANKKLGKELIKTILENKLGVCAYVRVFADNKNQMVFSVITKNFHH